MNIQTIGVTSNGFISIYTPEYNYINDGITIKNISTKTSISFSIFKKKINEDYDKIEIVEKLITLDEGDKISFKVVNGRILNGLNYIICKGLVKKIIIPDLQCKEDKLYDKQKPIKIILDDSTKMESKVYEVNIFNILDVEDYSFDWDASENNKPIYPDTDNTNIEITEDKNTKEINIPLTNTAK